jgi:orotate phosphoribosyltransferase
VTIALDRQEKASDEGEGAQMSAVQFVERKLGLQVVAIATLADLLQYLQASDDPALRAHFGRVAAYRERYGV